MIMMKKDNTYKQVGFKKIRQADGSYKDVEFQYSKDSNGGYKLTFEKGFTREIEGVLPLSLNGIGKDLKDYDIEGNIYQSDGVSPDTPQEVVGCGDRTGNLFDISIPFKLRNTTNTISASETGFILTKNVDAEQERPYYTIQVTQTGDYTLSFKHVSSDPVFHAGGLAVSAEIPTSPPNTSNVTTVYANEGEYITIVFSTISNSTGVMEISNIMLNSGSTPLPYEPYGYKVDVVSRGKNLWYLQSSYSFTTYYDINVNINAGHYLSYIIETNGTTDVQGGTGCQLTFSDNTTQYVFFNATYRKSILLSKDVKIVRVYAGKDYNTSVGFTATVSEIMVSANADDSYEPYTPPITTPIYLDSPLYKIGDYADNRGKTEEVRAIKELVLTGEESWLLQSINDYGIANFFIKVTPQFATKSNAFCTHFIEQNSLIADTTFEGLLLAGNETLYLRTKQERASTATAFKAYLKEQYNNGTPVKVYYVLSTSESKAIEPVEVSTLDGTTIIEAETGVKPSNVYLKYKSSK